MSAILQFPTKQIEWASATDSAKMLKQALRQAFPATKFSVKLSRGTGYGYCSVRWTDGPSIKRVQSITGQFEGSTFDGMQDMEIQTRAIMPNGQRSGLRGISESRQISARLANRCMKQAAEYWGGIEGIPTAVDGEYGFKFASSEDYRRRIRPDVDLDWSQVIHRVAEDRTEYQRED